MTIEIPSQTVPSGAQSCGFDDLAGKVVFVTGAGSGIGRAMAEAFAHNGARLALLDINGEALERTRQELQAAYAGIAVHTLRASTADDIAVEDAMAQVEARFGGIDILLNNAGISMNQPTLDLTVANWRKTIDINLSGVFYCAQSAGRRMVRQGHGVILNMASMYGVTAGPDRAAYCASKAAVVMLTKVLAIEWAMSGVRVNAIGPGYVRTELVDQVVQAGRINLESLIKRTPSGRLGKPEEIAKIALFLASDNAAFINGQTIVADGGWTAYGYI